jgi:hypothetical protein
MGSVIRIITRAIKARVIMPKERFQMHSSDW